jgi:uncharacterized protein DUF6869
VDEADKPRLPTTDDEMRVYTTRYFAEYDELGRRMEAGQKPDRGPVPSDLIFDLLRDGRAEEAWPLIVALVEAAPTEDAISFIGASVLEDLIREFGDRLVEQIVAQATADRRMRHALQSVWGWEDVSVSLRTRVQALLG